MEWIDEKKKIKIKKIFSYKGKVYSIVFSMLENEIREMLKDGYSKTIIVKILNEELETNINYFTFIKWFDKNIKQKSQNSNNTLKNNSQVKREVSKQNNNTTSNQEKEDNRPWWEKEIERASKGMKKAALRL